MLFPGYTNFIILTGKYTFWFIFHVICQLYSLMLCILFSYFSITTCSSLCDQETFYSLILRILYIEAYNYFGVGTCSPSRKVICSLKKPALTRILYKIFELYREHNLMMTLITKNHKFLIFPLHPVPNSSNNI